MDKCDDAVLLILCFVVGTVSVYYYYYYIGYNIVYGAGWLLAR